MTNKENYMDKNLQIIFVFMCILVSFLILTCLSYLISSSIGLSKIENYYKFKNSDAGIIDNISYLFDIISMSLICIIILLTIIMIIMIISSMMLDITKPKNILYSNSLIYIIFILLMSFFLLEYSIVVLPDSSNKNKPEFFSSYNDGANQFRNLYIMTFLGSIVMIFSLPIIIYILLNMHHNIKLNSSPIN